MNPNELANAVILILIAVFGGIAALYALAYIVIRCCGGLLPWWPKDAKRVTSLRSFFEGFL